MSESAQKKSASGKGDVPALKGPDKKMKKKQSRPPKDQQHDSDAIERAVYDGMQDLRATRSEQR